MRAAKAILFGLVLLACDVVKSPHDLALSGNGKGSTVRIDPGRAYGPGIEVDQFEDGYRGNWGARTVSLQVKGDRILGMLGSMPVDLHFKDENGTLDLQGMVAGQLGNLTVSPTKIDGQFAGCGYDLRKSEEGYKGLACGAGVTLIRFPEDWSERPAHERAAFLALLLTS